MAQAPTSSSEKPKTESKVAEAKASEKTVKRSRSRWHRTNLKNVTIWTKTNMAEYISTHPDEDSIWSCNAVKWVCPIH